MDADTSTDDYTQGVCVCVCGVNSLSLHDFLAYRILVPSDCYWSHTISIRRMQALWGVALKTYDRGHLYNAVYKIRPSGSLERFFPQMLPPYSDMH